MALATSLIASSTSGAGASGLLWIALTLVAIVVVIGAVWTFTARRASRMPRRTPHRHDQGVRGG